MKNMGFFSFLFSITIGAVVGLLVAPKKGSELRKDLQNLYEKNKDEDIVKDVENFAKEAKKYADDLQIRVEDLLDQVKDKIEGYQTSKTSETKSAPKAKKTKKTQV